MPAQARAWGVQLNELALYHAAPAASEWWLPYRWRMDTIPGKIIVLDSLFFDLIIIRCAGHEEATWLRGFLIAEKGFPAGTLKVRTIPPGLVSPAAAGGTP